MELLQEILIVLLVGRGLLYLVRRFLSNRRIRTCFESIPGPESHVLFGISLYNLKNLHRIYESRLDLVKQYGQTVKIAPGYLLGTGGVMITSAENVRHILSTNFGNYIKPPHVNDALSDLLGQGIFISNHKHVDQSGTTHDGQMWYIQRKVAAKVFSANSFRRFSRQVFLRYGHKVIEELETLAKSGDCLDLQRLMLNYTLESIFCIGFGCEVPQKDNGNENFHHAFNQATADSVMRLLKPWRKWFSWISPAEYRLRKNIRVIERIVKKVIQERQKEDPNVLSRKHDILSLFLQRSREMGKEIATYKFLRDVSISMLLAGRDTTASALTHLFYRLGRHPEIQEKLYNEIHLALEGNEPSYDALKNLPYLDAVVHETLRLHPPVPADPKYCVKDDVLPDGTKIPAGAFVEYWPYVMGRMESQWEEPLRYLPERWLEMDQRPTAFEFPVFQAGPRVCIGQSMAILESKVLVCMVLERFSIKLCSIEEPRYGVNMIFFMEDGLSVKVVERNT